MEYAIILFLIWIIVYQFIDAGIICENQGHIIEKINELLEKIEDEKTE